MKTVFLFLFILISSKAFSQDISGEWVSQKVNAYELKNESAARVYSININKKNKSFEGESKIYFKSKEGFLKTVLFGAVDTLSHTIIIHTESLRSSVDGTEEHMKDNNKYNWTYSFDGTKEYLTLVRDEEFPHIMLESNIVFSRLKPKHETPIAKQIVVIKGDSSIKSHPVIERKNKLFKEIIVDTNLVKIDLYDVGEIDGDSVSLFLNGKLVAEHQMLRASAITFTITLDKNLPENKLVLFAENLGRVPPNTAYMVITINKKEYTLNMQSDEKTNGEVVFRFAAK